MKRSSAKPSTVTPPDCSLRLLADRYLADFKYNNAETSYMTYRSWMRRFFKWLTDAKHISEPSLGDFNLDILDEYIEYHKNRLPQRRSVCRKLGMDKPIAANTVRAAMYCLQGLGRWLVDKRYIAFDPTEAASIPKKDNSGVRPITTDDVMLAVLEQAKRCTDAKKRALDVALLSLTLNCGARVAEIAKVEYDDMLVAEGRFRSAAKGHKTEKKIDYYFPDECSQAIQEYIPYRPAKCRHGNLFCRGPKQTVSDDYIRRIMNEYAAQLGLGDDKGIRPHAAKHLVACRLLTEGVDISTVASRLGHSKPTTTIDYYLHVSKATVEASRNISLKAVQVQVATDPQTVRMASASITRPSAGANSASQPKHAVGGTSSKQLFHRMQRMPPSARPRAA